MHAFPHHPQRVSPSHPGPVPPSHPGPEIRSGSGSEASAGGGEAPHPLARFGWDSGFRDAFAPYAGPDVAPARVVRVDRGRCDVVVADGARSRVVQADSTAVEHPDPARMVCTGDWAVLGRGAGEEPALTALLPRRTAFLRSTSSQRSEAQVLAANIDHALIAVSLATEPDLGRVERFVSLAWASGAQPLLVLTKSDLASPEFVDQVVRDAELSAPGVPVLAVSSSTGSGLSQLSDLVGAGTAVLLGQSGAGKSTLANAMLGEEAQRVWAVRDRDNKGRHTTTTRNLLPLPTGGVLIDTPGVRGVGLWDAGEGLSRTFSDLDALAAQCRFHDCVHGAEPGCAVLAAVEDGALPARRLESYRKLLRENDRIAAKTDARLRAELRREWKQKQALGRHLGQRKRGRRT